MESVAFFFKLRLKNIYTTIQVTNPQLHFNYPTGWITTIRREKIEFAKEMKHHSPTTEVVICIIDYLRRDLLDYLGWL